MNQAIEEDDQDLRNKLQAMDPDALSSVYDRFYSPIYRYVSFRINNAQTVEDLTSEVFTRLLSTLKKGKPPKNLKAWLFSVAHNVVTDQYRKSARVNLSPITENLESSSDSPAVAADRSLLVEQLRKGLHTLNETQQHVLALRFGYGMPIKEVAEQLGKSVGAIKMLQARAIAALAEEVQS